MGTRATTAKGKVPEVAEHTRRHDVVGIFAASFTVLSALALASYDATSGTNWIGAVGHGIANLLTMGFGLAAWVIPFELGAFTVRVFAHRPSPLGPANIAATLVLLLLGCALVHLAVPEVRVFGSQPIAQASPLQLLF